jgi:hypothetical protein
MCASPTCRPETGAAASGTGAAARAAPVCLDLVRRVHKSTTIPRSKPVIRHEAAARAIP